MNKPFILLLWLAAHTATAQAPATATSDDAMVREVIARLFQGMQQGDSALVHSAFTQQVTTATVLRDKNNTLCCNENHRSTAFSKP